MAEANQCPQCGAELPADAPQGVCPKCLLKLGLGSQPDSVPGPQPAETTPRPSRFVPPPVEQLAEKFPQLEILELVGSGGMGAVYKARQPGLDRLVALKILPQEVGGDSAFAERFTREARAMARLGHPNVVSVYDFGQADGLYYFVMEFVDGANLRETIEAGRLRSEEALAIVPQICDALQFAHDEGIVHRDIKPENILIDKKGRVKIADFGLAKLLGKAPGDLTLTGTGQVMGTPHYMAPEQMEKPLKVDHRVDIYSLGVVFYEMLTGELPIGRFAPPSKKVEVDVRLDEVVLRALENEPERRYQHASEVKTDVESVRGGEEATRSAVRPAVESPDTHEGVPESPTAGGEGSSHTRAAFVAAVMVSAHAVLWSALLAFLVTVVPGYEETFADLDAELPVLTQMLIGISRYLATHWSLLFMLGFAALLFDCAILFALSQQPRVAVAKWLWFALVAALPVVLCVVSWLALALSLQRLVSQMS